VKKLAIIVFILLVASISAQAKTPNKLSLFNEKIKMKVDSIKNEKYDTTRNDGYWKRALVHGDLNVYDKSVKYPKFLQFCLDVYRWGDKTFNQYDTSYVVSTGKNWKLMLKNNDWLDSYAGHLGEKRMPIHVNSQITTVVGAEIAFMAVNYSYMADLDNLFGGNESRHSKWRFSFTCALLYSECYYQKNEGLTNIHRFGDYKNGKWVNLRFSGITKESYGLNTYYFFNHRKYAQAASYCYSKYQKRSAGSFIAGLGASMQDIKMDFNSLDADIKQYLPDDIRLYHFRYRDYALLLGYGYNWVFKHGWLFNLTALPSIGYKHCFDNSIEGKKNLASFGFQGKLSLVKNHGRFFYALQGLADGHWYRSHRYSFYNSTEEMTVSAGFRF
jgi:hypothetical protein